MDHTSPQISLRELYFSVTIPFMEQCVMITGMNWKPKLYADSLDSHQTEVSQQQCITGLKFNPAIGSVPVSNAVFGEGYNRSIFLDQLTCTGNESSLLECLAQDEVGYHNCDHSEDAGVRCEGEDKKCEQ